ncbi:MAG: tetratricopeptide repeat protein [Deltaproteobacteria bacterium]|nr:tetratricopeptide repeat protein [Deltaproteobacteria bacterium]
MKPRILYPVTFALGLAALSPACGESPAPEGEPAGPSSTPAVSVDADAGPAAALAYVPDDSVTGRKIAAAQQQLRDGPRRIDAHLSLATVLMRRQRETSNAVLMRYAEDVLASARALAPADPQVKLMHAMTLQDGHRFEQAAERAREVLAADPDDTTAHLVLADAQLELGDYEGAMDSVQAAMDRRPDLRSYNRAAHLRWLVGDFDSALAIMELALDAGSSRDPEASAWCYADLGTMFLHRGDPARAMASADRALALVPGYVPGMAVKARALARQQRAPEAIALLSEVVERRAAVEDLLTLASWHEQHGEAEAAAQRRQQADLLADDDPRPMALDLARRGVQTKRAVKLAETALARRANIAAHDAMAMALARDGQHERARASMNEAQAMGTADANLHLHAAMVHALAGDPVQARAALAIADGIDAGADLLLRAELEQRLGAA